MSLRIIPETVVSLKPTSSTSCNTEEISPTNLTTKFHHQKAKFNTSFSHFSEDDSLHRERGGSISRKRRLSFHQKTYESIKRKRSYSCVIRDQKIILPTKFLLGGSIADPLNLNGLTDLPNMSPISSPWQQSPKSIDVFIPPNITDPLNLNSLDDHFLGKRRKRHRHKRKEESGGTDRPLHLTTPIGVDVSYEVDSESKTMCLSAPIPNSHNQTTSPQFTPISRRRRRTMSECASDRLSCKELKFEKVAASVSRAGEVLEKGSDSTRKNSEDNKERPDRQTQHVQKKKSKPKFIHGNYNRYYGYRNAADIEDSRMSSFRSDWFTSKDILDIGCNVGHLTILLAKNFQPKKIIGLDIDSSLISAARKNIRYYLENRGLKGKPLYPTSNNVVFGPLEPPPFGSDQRETTFPENIAFKQGNYVLQDEDQLNLVTEEYDTILALSITKWIHLNNGDEGIRLFFKRIYKHLRPGGKLILEPQPWASYKKRKNLTPNIHEHFQCIKLKPEQFREYLLAEIGFLKCEVINVPNHKEKGFRRPIQVYTKTDIIDSANNLNSAPDTSL